MFNTRNNSYQTDSSSFNTLDRELSIRTNHPDQHFTIQKEDLTKSKKNNKAKTQQTPLKKSESGQPIKQNNQTKSNSNKPDFADKPDRKIKYIETDKQNFKDFYSFGNKLGQNYNTDQENDLRFSESTRRKSLPKSTQFVYKSKSRDTTLDTIDEISSVQKDIINIINTDSKLRTGSEINNIMSINSNEIGNTAAKIPKASAEYWDNTKRRNLDTSIYTNNAHKIQGRGFGDINSYDVFLNGVGHATRQINPDQKPQNIEDDRIFLTNHNYNYDKHHVTEGLPCGSDTRYLNKKMI